MSVGDKVRIKATGKEARIIIVGNKGNVILNIPDMKWYERTVYNENELEVI